MFSHKSLLNFSVQTPSYIIKMDPQENFYFHGKISRDDAEKLLMRRKWLLSIITHFIYLK